MALNIKSPEVERLVEKLAQMTGESKTEAVLRAVAERCDRLSLQRSQRERGSDFLRYLAEEVWPKAPPGQLGRRLSREEEDEILGYGPTSGLAGEKIKRRDLSDIARTWVENPEIDQALEDQRRIDPELCDERESLTEAILHSMEERLERLKGRRSAPGLAEAQMAISQRCGSLPDLVDTRNFDEILGYDDTGAFR